LALLTSRCLSRAHRAPGSEVAARRVLVLTRFTETLEDHPFHSSATIFCVGTPRVVAEAAPARLQYAPEVRPATCEAPEHLLSHSPTRSLPRSPAHLAAILQPSCRAALARLRKCVQHSPSCTTCMPAWRMIRATSRELLADARAALTQRYTALHLAAYPCCSSACADTAHHCLCTAMDGMSGLQARHPQCHRVPGGPFRASPAARRQDTVVASAVDCSLQDAAGWRARACCASASRSHSRLAAAV
jgi:hypothetical protein